MNNLIPYFEINGKNDYPDDYKLFSEMTEVLFNNSNYWLCQYNGLLDLETGADNYVNYAASLEMIDIVITGITGDLYHEPDFSKAACYQLTDMVVDGIVNVEDRFFAMPVKNVATGEIVFFGAQVTNKAFSVVINFEKSSQYQYTNEEANLDLPSQEYNVLPMKFDVLRYTA